MTDAKKIRVFIVLCQCEKRTIQMRTTVILTVQKSKHSMQPYFFSRITHFRLYSSVKCEKKLSSETWIFDCIRHKKVKFIHQTVLIIKQRD